MQWKQGFLVEKDGTLYVAPIQYNARTGHWFTYNENNWDQRPWSLHTVRAKITCRHCHGHFCRFLALYGLVGFEGIQSSQQKGFRASCPDAQDRRGEMMITPVLEWQNRKIMVK